MLGLISILVASAADPSGLEGFAPRPLLGSGDAPVARDYRRIVESDGRVYGRSRTGRTARFRLWWADGVVVRLEERERGRVVARRRFDPLGQPLTTENRPLEGGPSVVVHGATDREIGLSGWTEQLVAGGTVPLPVPVVVANDGSTGAWVLGGFFEVWHDPRPADARADPFWEGLLAGCGCDLVDRVDAWVDRRPAVRFRLARGRDVQELWVVSLPDRDGGGTWYAGYRVDDVDRDDVSLRLAPGRALVAVLELDRLPIEVAGEAEGGPGGGEAEGDP